MKLWLKIVIAMAFGILTGFILGPSAEMLKPIGSLFLNMISMVIPLLVFSSMVVGVCSIHDPKKMGRVGIRTLAYFFGTTVISLFVGISIALIFQPGAGLELATAAQKVVYQPPDFVSAILSMVPSNPVASFVSGNVLQIIVFSLFLAFAINKAGEKGLPLLRGIQSLSTIMYRMITIIMEFSPIGVFAIMSWVAGSFGMAVLVQLGKFVFFYYIACFLHLAFVFCGILWVFARLNPIPFFKGYTDAIAMAFSTSSSSATLPITMRCAQENLGVSPQIANFVLPLGCSLNMNGTAIFQGMSVFFIAQAYGIELDIMQVVSLVLTAVLANLGTAGVPGSGFIMLSALLASAGLPLEGLAILAGIDRLRDMIGTVMNVLGEAIVAVVIAKQENELDESVYYGQVVPQLQKNEVISS